MESKAKDFFLNDWIKMFNITFKEINSCRFTAYQMQQFASNFADQQTQELREENQKQAEVVEKLKSMLGELVLFSKQIDPIPHRADLLKLKKAIWYSEELLSTLKETDGAG